MASKKTFEAIARTMRESRKVYFGKPDILRALDVVSAGLAADLSSTNPRFSTSRFMSACNSGLDLS